jgi:hypothetical protein
LRQHQSFRAKIFAVTPRLRPAAGVLPLEQFPFVAEAPQPLTLSFGRLPVVAQAAAGAVNQTVVLPALAVQALVRARLL